MKFFKKRIMKTSKRFDKAIEKLYRAFHNNTLNPECCIQCAVGNICDNTDAWRLLTPAHGSVVLSYLGKLNEAFERRIAGYKPSELLRIEAVFLEACGYELPFTGVSKKPPKPITKNRLFKGLTATVSYLCKLENIPDVMDCSKLFNFEPILNPQEDKLVLK